MIFGYRSLHSSSSLILVLVLLVLLVLIFLLLLLPLLLILPPLLLLPLLLPLFLRYLIASSLFYLLLLPFPFLHFVPHLHDLLQLGGINLILKKIYSSSSSSSSFSSS